MLCWLLGHRWQTFEVSPVVEAAVDAVVQPFSWWTNDWNLEDRNRECTRCQARIMTLDTDLLDWANATSRLRQAPGSAGPSIRWAPAPPQLGLSVTIARQPPRR